MRSAEFNDEIFTDTWEIKVAASSLPALVCLNKNLKFYQNFNCQLRNHVISIDGWDLRSARFSDFWREMITEIPSQPFVHFFEFFCYLTLFVSSVLLDFSTSPIWLLLDYLLYSHHLTALHCIDIVRRNSKWINYLRLRYVSGVLRDNVLFTFNFFVAQEKPDIIYNMSLTYINLCVCFAISGFLKIIACFIGSGDYIYFQF